MHECHVDIAHSNQPSNKFAKGVVLSKAKMARNYMDGGGKRFVNKLLGPKIES